MQPVNPSKRAQAVEILRAISEVIIYGDQRQTNQIFDYFCEKNMLFLFTQMLHVPGGCGSAISRQIIQTVSILVQNIQNPTYLFYLLSNNHVNEIILHKFDFRDEDVLAQYASFVKMLSLLLDENTIQFMFDGRQASFPLYTESIKLMDSTEGMVRTHSRVLALNVYRMSDDAMAQFILSPAHRGVFGKLVRYVRGRCMQLGNRLRGTLGGINSSDGNPSGNNSKKKKRSFSSPRLFSSPSRQNKWPSHQQQKQQKQQKQQSITVDQIKSEVNDVIDEFYFFQDVLEAGKHGISDALSDAILIHLIYPCLIPALGLQEGNNRTNDGQDGGSGNGDGNNGSGRNGERDNSQSRSFNNKSHILQSSPRHRSRGMSSHAYDVSTPDGGVGSQVSTLLSLFMLTQLMYAMQHDNIIHAIAVCCMSRGRADGSAAVEEEKDNTVNRGNQESNGEPDLFSFIVGFKDPMVKKDEKTKATEATEAAALEIPKHTKGHASAIPPCHNYIVPIPPPPSQLLTKTVDYQSEDTDYEDDEKEGVDGVDGVDGIELNVGCPQQCARKGRYGAFMMDDPDALVETVRLLSNTLRRCGTGDVPLLVKMRCYVNVEDTVVLCKRLEHAGCSCLTLHGRTKRDKGRTGKAHKALADWNQIKAVKAALRIPVIGNGNVRSKADALEMISVCGVDGVMSGMGLLSNPALFDDASMVGAATPTAVTRIRVALRYLFLCSLHEPYHVCLSKHVQKILGDSLQKQYQGMHTLLLSYMSFSKKEGRANTSRLDLVNELEKMLVVEEERVMGGTCT